MPLIADRVRDTTTTTGTGTVTVSGTPPTGFRTFGTVFAVGDAFYYGIGMQSASTEWEVGVGTMTNSTAFTRDQVLTNSNGAGNTDLISFSAGTKDVICDMPSFAVDPNNLGIKLALQMNWLMN